MRVSSDLSPPSVLMAFDVEGVHEIHRFVGFAPASIGVSSTHSLFPHIRQPNGNLCCVFDINLNKQVYYIRIDSSP